MHAKLQNLRELMRILSLLLALTLTACATPYQPEGFSGGYSETQLDTDKFKVNFRGNAIIQSDVVNDYALLRASELALNNGFNYFEILSSKDSVKVDYITTPVSAHTTSTYNTHGTLNSYGNYGTYSGYTTGNSYTTFSGGNTTAFRKPHSNMLIQCYKEKDSNKALFDANFLIKTLVAKHKIDLNKN